MTVEAYEQLLATRQAQTPLRAPAKAKRPAPRHEPGKMNPSEEAYSHQLEARKAAGEIIRWAFEPVKFVLAERTTYTPDFMVVTANQIEFHEFKGFWRDDARVKIKVAAALFPEFLFVAVQKVKKQYEYEEF